MLFAALKTGWVQAVRQPGLVAIAWSWNLALAALGVLPFWAWSAGATAPLPETDRLLNGLNLGVVTELIQAAPGAFSGIAVVTAAVLGIALVSNAFLTGGILHVVTGGDGDAALLARFFGGAGRYFGRFVRLLVLALASGLAGVLGVSAALGALTRPMASNGWEPGMVLAAAVVGIGAALVLAYVMLVLDYARIRTVVAEERRMARMWWWAMRFVARRTLTTAALGFVAALVVVAALAVWSWMDGRLSPSSTATIALGLLVQQAVLFVRTGARVAQLGSEAAYHAAVAPPVGEREVLVHPAADPRASEIGGDTLSPTDASLYEASNPESGIGNEARRPSSSPES